MFVYYSKISSFLTINNLSFYLDRFPLSYQEKLMRYRRKKDVIASLMGRLLLKQGLKKIGVEWDYEVEVNEYGKPFILNEGVCFNISHSSEYVLCAIRCGKNVGVDIEKNKSVDLSSFREYMTMDEWSNIINSGRPIDCFYDYWTKKEAVLKAYGSGLINNLNEVDVISNVVYMDSKKFLIEKINAFPGYSVHISYEVETDISNTEFEKIQLRPVFSAT